MTFNKLAGSIVIAATVLGAGSAFAQSSRSAEYYPLAEIMSMKMIDKNKDGMVSKKEFMDMMSMAWDMNAKKMNTKGDMMNTEDFNQVLMYLKAGG